MIKKSKLVAFAFALGLFSTVNAQLVDEKDVTVTLDLQPVLELEIVQVN